MIYKLIFDDREEIAQAKSQLHLLQSYDELQVFQDIQEVIEISEEEAKSIVIKNTEYDESNPSDSPSVPLSDLIDGDDFKILASTEVD